jgi:hypothetical protein
MKWKRNRPNRYPLPDKTVLYSRKKHIKPVPQVGMKYHCFDDGKITFSRHYIVKITEVLGQMAFKRKYPEYFKMWLEDSKRCYWLYARTTDKFVVTGSLGDANDQIEVFVRTKQGGWFSFSMSFLGSGRLDVTGKLWDNLLSYIDEYDYSDEEKEQIIKEGTIS